MEFKGKKGEWRVVDATPIDSKNLQIKTDDLISVIDSERETIAICGRKEAIQIANAKLIASAPEMFEMLKEILEMEIINLNKIEELLTKITE